VRVEAKLHAFITSAIEVSGYLYPLVTALAPGISPRYLLDGKFGESLNWHVRDGDK
jgi:hypothetical protein